MSPHCTMFVGTPMWQAARESRLLWGKGVLVQVLPSAKTKNN